MGLHLRRLTMEELARLLERCPADTLTYGPTGGSLGGASPAGFQRRRWSVGLRSGVFDRAVEAIRGWTVHRGAGVLVAADGPIALGSNAALSAPLPIGWVDATCRIVGVVDEADRFGFAYGTLSVHPERGEESFIIVRETEGATRFDVEAVSRPKHPVARALPAVANRLQDTAVRRYLSAMTRATSS